MYLHLCALCRLYLTTQQPSLYHRLWLQLDLSVASCFIGDSSAWLLHSALGASTSCIARGLLLVALQSASYVQLCALTPRLPALPFPLPLGSGVFPLLLIVSYCCTSWGDHCCREHHRLGSSPCFTLGHRIWCVHRIDVQHLCLVLRYFDRALISTVQGQPIAEELLLLQITVASDERPVTLEGHLGRMMIWRPFPGVLDSQWRAFPSCLLSPFTPEENSTVRADVQLHLLLNLYVSHCFCEDIPDQVSQSF